MKPILTPLLFAALAGSASAAVLASDNFDGYAATGSIVGQTPTTGSSGFSANWAAASGVAGTALNTNGTVVTSASGTHAAARNLTSTLAAAGQHYFSIQFNPTANNSFFGLAFFAGSNGAGTQQGFVGDGGTGTTWAVNNGANVFSTTTVAVGATTTLVGVLDFTNDKIIIWVNPSGTDGYNPSVGGGTPTGHEVSAAYTYSSAIQSVRLSSGVGVTFDNLVIGSTPQDVGLVPEPSAALLGGLGLLGLLRRRR